MQESIEHVAPEIAGKLQEAWNRGDGPGFAAAFRPDADFIHIMGGHGRGRAAIAQAHQSLFETVYRGSRVLFEVERIRPVAQGACIAYLLQHLTFGPVGDLRSMTCRPTLLLTREGEDWSIAFMQNTRVAEAAPEGLSDHPFAPSRTLVETR